MPTCRLNPLATALLGLGLLGLSLATALPGQEAEKVGACPELAEDGNCTKECSSDSECHDNLKCCRAGCSAVCTMPNEKQGSCPKIDISYPQLGLCIDQCHTDSECPDQMKCCHNGCGKVSCVTPTF